MHEDETFRMLDANLNRGAEGLRVLEDICRFYLQNETLTGEWKKIRHALRKEIAELGPFLLAGRNALTDVGVTVSQQTRLDDKASWEDLMAGNCKRVQEALRVLEEGLKISGYYEASKKYEGMRFQVYTMEKKMFGLWERRKKSNLLATDLYCITAEEHSRGRSNLEVVAAMLAAGIQVVQYREKDKKMRRKYEECSVIREMTRKAGALFIINDDLELARLVEADGVHVGQDDLPVEKVRELVGEGMVIGLSTHSPEQAQGAVDCGADYIGVGPLFSTRTKKDVCDPVGLSYLEYVVKNISLPFVAIGGIKEHNIGEVVRRGASCISLVTDIVGAEDIGGKINVLRNMIREAKIS